MHPPGSGRCTEPAGSGTLPVATPRDTGKLHASSRPGETADAELTELHSVAFSRALAQLRRLARDPCAPILLEGESGTGKTSLARAIHRWSPRAGAPFQHVVLSALDDSVAGSELFGHVAGAFTDARRDRAGQFASANGGTLFLDEIGKASRAIQQKLLHAIEYQEIRPIGSDRQVRLDVRIVTATNLPLENLVAAGEFLPDLEARLMAFRVRLPPLRERRADIAVLAHDAVQRRYARCGYDRPPEIGPDLMLALQRAPWPNNLRQLDSTLHRLLVDAAGATTLTLAHCDNTLLYLRECAGLSSEPLSPDRVVGALRRAGTISGAARLLGVDRKTLRRHWQQLEQSESATDYLRAPNNGMR